MKSLRFKVNFELPLRYENVVWGIYSHLHENPEIIGRRRGQSIRIVDIYRFCVDVTMDYLGLDFKNDDKKEDLEFVKSPQEEDKDSYIRKLEADPELRKDEYELVKTLTSSQLNEYEKDYQTKGFTIKDYLAIKESLG